jgi:L-iditol 2-dehydrogenase
MKAAVLKGLESFSIESIPDPICPAGGVVVKVKTAAICSADVRMIISGHQALRYPRIPGHEISGVVVHSDNAKIKVGERVQIAPGITCGVCRFCKSGLENHCENIRIFGFTLDGGFAEYIAIPSQGVFSGVINLIPESLGFDQAAMAEPVACCLNGQEILDICLQDRVLIIGAGPIGCIHTILARLNGAEEIILADIYQKRLNLALKTEADIFLNISAKNKFKKTIIEKIEALSINKIILACSACESLMFDLIEILAPRGRICFFSGIIPQGKNPGTKIFNKLHYKEAVFSGAYGCTSNQNRKALALMESGKINLDWMITHKFTLEDIMSGLEIVRNLDGLKTLIQE